MDVGWKPVTDIAKEGVPVAEYSLYMYNVKVTSGVLFSRAKIACFSPVMDVVMGGFNKV